MPIVISASRRTDIPAFYMPWFMGQIEKGYFKRINPVNRRQSKVTATPDRVHTIVFWSKNFETFAKKGYDRQLQARGYRLFYQFTINSESALLEPRVPPLRQRFQQLDYLCRQNAPRSITWRFDPICFFGVRGGMVQNNLSDFDTIAKAVAKQGIRRCITSVMDHYAKIKRRLGPGLQFFDPPLTEKIAVLLKLDKTLKAHGIELSLCCEKELLAALPKDAQIPSAACISHDLLIDLFDKGPSQKPDRGQRIDQGCGCEMSVDIGSYAHHPCYHNCLFCYANPAQPTEMTAPAQQPGPLKLKMV